MSNTLKQRLSMAAIYLGVSSLPIFTLKGLDTLTFVPDGDGFNTRSCGTCSKYGLRVVYSTDNPSSTEAFTALQNEYDKLEPGEWDSIDEWLQNTKANY